MNLVNLVTMQKLMNLVIKENSLFQLLQVLPIIILMAHSNILTQQHQFTTSKIDLKDQILMLTHKMDQVPTIMAERLEMIQNGTELVFVVIFLFLQVLDQQTTIQMALSS